MCGAHTPIISKEETNNKLAFIDTQKQNVEYVDVLSLIFVCSAQKYTPYFVP